MKVLAYHTMKLLEENHIAHFVHFDFMGKKFFAYVIENSEITNVERCYNLEDEDIDIPSYFGTGFAGEVYTLIYDQVEKGER